MKVGVIGHALLDYEYVTEKIPLPDDEARIIESYVSPGGSALNTATGLARLKGEVKLIANIGNDKRGRILLDFIKNVGLEKQGLKIERGETGYCIVIRDLKGEVSLISKLNVAEPILLDERRLEAILANTHIHLTSLTPFTIKEIIDKIKEAGFNGSISWDIGRITAEHVQLSIADILRKINVVFISRREAKKIDERSSPEITAEKLSRLGNTLVILKQQKGAAAFEKGRRVSRVKIQKEFYSVDTLGAGDAFAAAFLNSYLNGSGVGDSLGRAVIYAALKIGKRGGSNMPRYSEFENMWGFLKHYIVYY
ncbi:MAG: carbohydrate kinase family protein [Fervidicoccaceae archaeon]